MTTTTTAEPETTTDFNSHAHVERDGQLMRDYIKIGISTHTLTWSVTISDEFEVVKGKFQLTRSRGA